MIKYYYKAKNYLKDNNPIIIFFLLIFPCLSASFNFVASFLNILILSVLLVSTKMLYLFCTKYFSKKIYYSLFVIYASTYASIIYIITTALFPDQIRTLILVVPTLLMYGVLAEKPGYCDNLDRTIGHCYIDGFLYFIISLAFVVVINFINILNIFDHNLIFSFINFALATIILQNIVIRFEKYFANKVDLNEE